MDRSPDFHKRGGGKLAHDRRFVSNSLVESFFGISENSHVEKNKFSS